ncbi:MAG: hypothetical protein KAR39_09560 [Thermoplasmata archaeon]|nr:hypothetical protein [Thermoplasmata archaeon]
MDEIGGEVSQKMSADIRIVDLATKRSELALNCRFRSLCYAHSKNCYTCPRRGGVQYILKNSEGRFHDAWGVFDTSGGYRSANVTEIG